MAAPEAVVGLIDAAALAEDLARRAPFVGHIGHLAAVGSGFFSHVYRTADGWIVRVARTRDAAERHLREVAILPALAGKLPLAIPEPRVALTACGSAPYGATAYRALPGRVMQKADADGEGGSALARMLARALASLYATPHQPLIPLGLPRSNPMHLSELRAATTDQLYPRLAAAERTSIDNWWDATLDGGVLAHAHATLTHGDPWWENLVVDGAGLSGILDWEWLSLSDPANDLGVTLQMGEPFFQQVLATYQQLRPADASIERRARTLFASRVFYGIQFAFERNDEREWTDALAKLRGGPILHAV